jgi:hypothetical protein
LRLETLRVISRLFLRTKAMLHRRGKGPCARYLERNRELPAEAMRNEFRSRFQEGTGTLREQARQRSTELGTELRARYDTAKRQLKKES